MAAGSRRTPCSTVGVWHLGGPPNISTWLEHRNHETMGTTEGRRHFHKPRLLVTRYPKGSVASLKVLCRGITLIFQKGISGVRGWPGGGEMGHRDLLADANPEA